MAHRHRRDRHVSDDTTAETPASGLVIHQPRRGFRYAADAFWVAGFALEAAPAARTALDLGTGSGIIAALLASRGIDALGIDALPAWAALWRASLAQSRVAGRLRLELSDVRGLRGVEADIVTCNPPFFAKGTGPSSSDPWKSAARTEGDATLTDFAASLVGNLAPHGVGVVVVPREREAAWIRACAEAGGTVAEVVRVGARRSLARVGLGPAEGAPALCLVDEDHARVRLWYALARAGCVAGDTTG